MKLVLPVTEALALARAARPLPSMITDVRAHGSAIEADIDAGAVTGAGGGLRGLMGKMAGTVTVTATFTGFASGVATFAIKAQARGMSVEGMIGQFAGTITRVVTRAGLPADAVTYREGASGPQSEVSIPAEASKDEPGVYQASFIPRESRSPGARFRQQRRGLRLLQRDPTHDNKAVGIAFGGFERVVVAVARPGRRRAGDMLSSGTGRRASEQLRSRASRLREIPLPTCWGI